MRSLILGGVGVKAIFRCGRDDAATLGKDIFDDARAFQFPLLPVGTMMLWRRGQETIEVEVNEPLVRVGMVSSKARALIDVLRASNGDVQDRVQSLQISSNLTHHSRAERARVFTMPSTDTSGTANLPTRRVESPAISTESQIEAKITSQTVIPCLEDWICS